ncbi:MAG: Maf family protein [Myxococcales bacterium]|nr:Maf family protein [Myxococcales bacterium]MDH5307185.1 Maf family protein [Myxococcales bacterium]MDH5568140.1 Maf family protein [Myxococcales bacterium]
MSASQPLPLLLASSSPRRRELLARAGLHFEVRPAQIDEAPLPRETPSALVARLADAKALDVARQTGTTPARVVLGADTIVVLDDCVLGKPVSEAHAEEMLGRLMGRTHRVITGVAIARSDTLELWRASVESRVSMRMADREEIRAYVASGESQDKAGAYAVQGEGRRFIERIEGSETNVIGLPLDETLELLRAAGVAVHLP